MSNVNSTLTQERVKELLNYDPTTGIFTWKVNVSSTGRIGNVAGSPHRAGYLLIRIDRRLYLAHRLAALYMEGKFPPALIDHLDMNKSNNLKTGLLGVYWSELQQKWGAKVNFNRRQHHAGFHSTPELAHEAYVKLKRELHPFGTL